MTTPSTTSLVRKLRLTDFQCHEDLTVEFDKITSIVGPSDVGKSAILRALAWVAFNTPLGDSFVRDGCDSCKVTVWTEAHRVTRRRGPGYNDYVLDGEVYKAFGSGVPPAVSLALGLGPYNVQRQLDPPLWLLDSAGQVGRSLNSVVHLDLIDDVLTGANALVRDKAAKAQAAALALTQAKESLQELDWVGAAGEQLDRLENLEALHETTCGKASRLESLLKVVAKATNAQIRGRKALSLGQAALAAGAKASEASARRAALEDLLRKARESEALTVTPDFAPVEQARAKGDAQAEKARTLESVLTSLKRAQESLCQSTESLRQAEAELTAKAGTTCPACHRPADPSQFLSQTSTSPPDHPLRDRRSRIGSPPKPAR